MTTTSTATPAEPIRETVLPRGVAAVVELLAVGAAIAFGHLVGAMVSPASSPFLAVGDTVIRFSPQWLTEFAKSTFGTADKPILLGGMAVVIALLAALVGIASRRSSRPGLVGIVVLGAAGVAAVAAAPVFGPTDLAAPLTALVVGVAVQQVLHRAARAATAARTAGGAPDGGSGGGISRRGLFVGSAVGVAVASLAAAGGSSLFGSGLADSRRIVTARLASATLSSRAPAIPAGAAFPQQGTPTFLTRNADFYRIDVALQVPEVRAENWSLRVHGMVDRELVLTFDDLLKRPLVERTITMTCVSNPVNGDLVSTANFVGVDLGALLLEAGIRPGADQLFSTSVDGWATGTPTGVVMEPGRGAMLAIGMNGEALPAEHGFPVRMVVPGLYGYVSATKWVTDIEVTTFGARRGYWLERGWAQKAPIKTQSRIDLPRGLSSVPAGRVTVAGTAWSQPTGISAVEVRVDDGPWQRAELSTEVNASTWRMWRTTFDLAPGSHSVETRAIDRNGVTQTETRTEPIPDGASGWPSIVFTTA